MTDVQEQTEPRFTIYLRLAREIFEEKYAKDVSDLYRKASELKEKLTRFNELSKDEISMKTPKEQRDDQLTAMTLKQCIFKELPVVLGQIRILQLKFEQDVEKQYNKQAYKSKGNVTPIDDDAIWVSVLPAEIADLIPDVISEAPREVIASYKTYLDEKKKKLPQKNDSLQPLLDAATGSKLMTSLNMSKIRSSERLNERLTHSNRNSILAMSMSKCQDNMIMKSRGK